MSGIAGSEVVLLIIIGLIVLGPKRLPQVANQIGSWLGQARRMTRMMKRQLEQEVNFDLHKELGIDENGNPIPTAGSATPASSVSSPGYVQDRPADNKIHADEGTQSRPDEPPAADEPAEELPDDYSPAHAADDLGTGVGDDAEYIDDDELDALKAGDANNTGATHDAATATVVDSVASNDAAEAGKKETA